MEKQCSICHHDLNGAFCSNCGQKAGYKDTTFFSLISEMLTSAIDLEKSALAAIFLIIRDPYRIVSNFWHGNRRYYPGPGRMILYAIAVAAFHLTYIGDTLMGAYISSSFASSQVFLWVVLIPLLTITSWLTYAARKFSFTKHLISVAYLSSGLFIPLVILVDLGDLVLGMSQYGMVIFLFCFFIWNARVFGYERGVGSLLLGILLQVLIFIGIIVAFSIYVMRFHPEAVNTNL